MNEQIDTATWILQKYNETEDSLEVNLTDLISDLMHWCKATEINFYDVIQNANNNFLAEQLQAEIDSKYKT